MAERKTGHRKSCSVLSAHFPDANWRPRPVAKSAYYDQLTGPYFKPLKLGDIKTFQFQKVLLNLIKAITIIVLLSHLDDFQVIGTLRSYHLHREGI